jgi:UDP-N-acetylmuramoyl-tripeptide--D-alanyl-D-alanine ligase
MNLFPLILTLLIFLIGLRTISWHLQNWQLREYRWDRMRAHLRTKDGLKNFFNLWFFKGIFPRPRKSGRMIMTLGVLFFIFFILFEFTHTTNTFPLTLTLILWERTLFITVFLAVFITRIPVEVARKILFFKAKRIVKNSNVKRIGITGSFGKSSTKQILIHLLQSKFGEENVLFNPGNENNEVAIARLIIKHNHFFLNPKSEIRNMSSTPIGDPKFLVAEIGAYRRGEIKGVCKFVQPHTGILTGINAQHIELFGSQRNIQRAKFELAEAATEKVFFNADSPLLREIAEDREVNAVKIPISLSVAENLKSDHHQSTFEMYGENMTLPWSGAFFVSNALLAMEAARESGMPPSEITKALHTLPPLDRALNMKTLKNGATLLEDLYSANPDGVLGAIQHLGTFGGKKVFVGIPLRELGAQAEDVHRRIFTALEKMDADVFWLKPDFTELGKEICGSQFHGNDIVALKKLATTLKPNDAVLLESRLPKNVVDIFS